MPIATERDFNRYSIATRDLEKALEFASEARHYPANSVVYEALLFAAIVSYSRPFSGNEKLADAPAVAGLSVGVIGALSGLERKIHDRCRTLRNKALAHSEFALNPTRLRSSTGVVVSRPFSLLSPPFDLDGFIQVVAKLRLICERDRADYVLRQRRRPVEETLNCRHEENP
jgi:hypothetical protein